MSELEAAEAATTTTTPAHAQVSQPIQQELAITPPPQQSQRAAPGATTAPQGYKPEELAKLMADNQRMKAELTNLKTTADQDASDKQSAAISAAAEKSRLELDAVSAQLAAANSHARRNAIKAYFKGMLKADTYLALMPSVAFLDSGELSAESVDALDQFRTGHGELFHQASKATTPLSVSAAGASADGVTDEVARVLRANRVPLPGTPEHWSQRKNVDVFGSIVGHNVNHKPYGEVKN